MPSKSTKALLALLSLISVGITAKVAWRKPTSYFFTRLPPETPPDWKPKVRTWIKGVEQYEDSGPTST